MWTKTRQLWCAFQQVWIQVIASFTGCLSCLSFSAAYVWPAPALPKMLADNATTVEMTTDSGSWLAPLAMLGLVLATPFTTLLVQRYGNKAGVLAAAAPAALSWLLVAIATNVQMLYAARLLVGFIDGFTFQAVPMYVSEVTEPRLRGRLLSLAPALMYTGSIVTYSAGYALSISTFAYIALAFTGIQFLSFLFMPNSPYYLLSLNRDEDARRALQTLRRSDDVTDELRTIRTDIDLEQSKTGNVLDLFVLPLNRKALYIAIVITALQNTCGLTSISSYVHLIVIEVNVQVHEIIPATLFGIVQLLTSFLTSALVDRIGRRPLLITSCIGLSICLILEGAYFYMKDYGYNVDQFKWLPIASLLLYVVFVTIGVGTIPYILYGEIFQNNIKTVGLAFVNISFGVFGVICTKAFQLVTVAIGMFAIFWIFAGLTLIGAVFVYKIIPETKNRTLAEVQTMLESGKIK